MFTDKNQEESQESKNQESLGFILHVVLYISFNPSINKIFHISPLAEIHHQQHSIIFALNTDQLA